MLAARRAAQLDEVRTRCGSKALAVVADVPRRGDVQRVFEQAIARFGRVDLIVRSVHSERTMAHATDIVRQFVEAWGAMGAL